MTIPFFDLTRQFEAIRADIEAAVDDVLTSQRCIGGPHVAELEARLADRIGTSHAIGVSSGTDALLASLMALEIGPGDEVVTTPFTFFAPVEAILRCGARPVFVDIDPGTFNFDTDQLRAAITARTKAILPVHLFGQACDMTAICAVAEARGIPVVEDMAQAIDATHRGRMAGNFGTTGCVSFFPTKNLGAAGDGGMVFCDDAQLAARIRRICRHGAEPKYHHIELGGNFRLDALQAAILGVKLNHLDRWTRARCEHAQFYTDAFGEHPQITTPIIEAENSSVFHQYTIRVPNRDHLRQRLSERGVGANIYYPEPLHTQPVLNHLGYREGDFPESERACREVLALPIFPELTDEERRRVVEVIVDEIEC